MRGLRKTTIKSSFNLLAALLTLLASAQATAQWTLSADDSSLSFISVKAEHIAEVHSFARLSGEIDSGGEAVVSIDLTSVQTGIDIRNERMQSMLFNTDMYPRAQVSADVDAAALSSMAVGESAVLEVPLAINLHGEVLTLSAPLRVSHVQGGLRVDTLAPIIVKADAFALVDGIESLREIAGLPSISRSVPVSFSLLFSQ
jgi:hypothetical protein